MPLPTISALVKADLLETDRLISRELKSEVSLINQLIEYILHAGGKRIRPLLVLLTAKAFNHQNHQHIELAAAIELIHTATLLHDDVVDNSTLRRGRATANSLYGNEASVLVGDFLYSRAFQLIVKLKHNVILDTFSRATSLIAEGEVLQLMNCHNPDTSESAYFEVIERKTAKLFEIATQTGAALASDSFHYLQAMQDYGRNLGIAYQLIDDALDYSACSDITGKNIGNDLAEGKPTLPLIYALTRGKSTEVAILRDAIQRGATERLPDILEIIETTGAIQYTANAAKHHVHHANRILQTIPSSPYRKGLEQLAEFVVERNY